MDVEAPQASAHVADIHAVSQEVVVDVCDQNFCRYAMLHVAKAQIVTFGSARAPQELAGFDVGHEQRVTASVGAISAVILAIVFPDRIFNRVLFAWQALAATFGPLLVVTLWRGPVRPAWRVAALSTGFLLTVILNWTIDSPGDWVERLVPLSIALGLAWAGASKIPD